MFDLLTFEFDGDETTVVRYNHEEVITLNHDEDGWSGIERCSDALKRFAELEGIAWKDI